MIEVRVKTKIQKEELLGKVGKILTDADYNLLLTGPTRVLKPDGKLLCIYRPKYFASEWLEQFYQTLHIFKDHKSENRGLASGMKRVAMRPGVRTYTKPI